MVVAASLPAIPPRPARSRQSCRQEYVMVGKYPCPACGSCFARRFGRTRLYKEERPHRILHRNNFFSSSSSPFIFLLPVIWATAALVVCAARNPRRRQRPWPFP